MGYMPKDCGKCSRVVHNSKGSFCIALGRYINNYQVTGEFETGEDGSITNDYYRDHRDPKCDFNPNADYNIEDYYEKERHPNPLKMIIDNY